MDQSSDKPLIYLHWALVVSLAYLVLLGELRGAVLPGHLLYVAALLGGSVVMLRMPFRGPQEFRATLVGFDTVFAMIALTIHGPVSREFVIGYFVCIAAASLGDSQGRLAGAALLATTAYTLWLARAYDLIHAWSLLLRVPFLFAATVFYGAAIQRMRTRRRRDEDQNRRSLSLLRSIIDCTADGILVVDLEGRIVAHNKRLADMWRIPVELLESGDERRGREFVSDQLKDPRTFIDLAQARFADPESEFRDVLEFKDGRVFERYSQPHLEGGETVGRVWSFRDVTARVQAEEAARRSDARYRDLFEGVPLGLYRTTPDGRFEDVNEAFAQTLGYPDRESLRRTSVVDLYVNPEDRKRLRAVLEKDQYARTFEVVVRRFDGSEMRAAINARVVRDEHDVVLGYEGIVEDVTERHKAEQAVKEALRKSEESNRLKTSFLANMNHEIRTPLNIILGYNELLQQGAADATSNAELVDAIRQASHRLLETIDGMLDLAKLQTGTFDCRPTPLKLATIVPGVVQQFRDAARRKGLDLACEVASPDAEVRFDEYCIQRALHCLLDNAIKFTQRGSISVRALRDPNGELCVEVADTGIGIAPEHLPRLFQPFTQEHTGDARQFEGSGVGLAAVKGLVELNRGRVTVCSEKGMGSRFTIHFDRVSEITRPAGSNGNGNGTRAKATVLVVEDDRDSLLYVKTVLGRSFNVLGAPTAVDARRALADPSSGIRLVLMDVSLKGGEDGIELTRFIRSRSDSPRLPVVAATAHAVHECRLRALEAGCDAFLPKPFSPQKLLETVCSLLRAAN